MKKIFIIIIFFSLCFISPSQADDIKDFQIGGMSLGDSLLKHFDKSEIKNNSHFLEQAKGNKEFKKYGKNISGIYDKISVTFKASDQNFTSKSIRGIKWFKDDINSCLKIRDEIINITNTEAFTEKRIEEQLYTGYLEQTENGYKISNTIKNFISLKNLISTIFNTGS